MGFFQNITNLLFNTPKTYNDGGRSQMPASANYASTKEVLNLTEKDAFTDVKFSHQTLGENNMFFKKEVNGNNYIISASSTDDIKNSFAVETSGFGKTLEEKIRIIKENIGDKGEYKVFLPISQNQKYFFGLASRAHYTLLELSIENGKLVDATHFDSKGYQSSIYSLSNIETTICNVFNGASLKAVYLGDQGMFDNSNCGRFVIKTIHDKINQTESDLIEIFNKIDSVKVYNDASYVPKDALGSSYDNIKDSEDLDDFDIDDEDYIDALIDVVGECDEELDITDFHFV